MSGRVYPPPFAKGAIINEGNIIVDPAALGHETLFADGTTRKPTEADIIRVFQINAKLKVSTREPNGTWKWEDWAEDIHAKPKPRLRKNNLMCFAVVNGGTQFKVFHYHKGFYDT
jgi:hypothetical protein